MIYGDIVYINGGIYSDMDAICLDNPEIFIKNSYLVCAAENSTHLYNWTFAAPPLSPILKSVINESVNIILKTENFTDLGEHFIQQTTGPGIFTIGIEKYLENKKIYENYKEDIIHVFPY